MSARTRVRHGALAGVGAATLTLATVLVGPSAAAAPADDGSSPTVTEESTGANPGDMDPADMAFGDMDSADMDRWIPEALQQDLQELQDLPAEERAAAMRDIVTDALSGEYGEDIENRTEQMWRVWSSLPTDLRDDLASAFGQEPEQIGEELSQVFEDARDGAYGQSVKFWTDWVAGTASSWDVGSRMGTSSD